MQGHAKFFFFFFFFFAVLTSATELPGQVPARVRTPAVEPIASVLVVGNRNLATDAILTAAGLKVGQVGGGAVFDSARDRLLATGYFDLVSYSFKQSESGFAITFKVAETTQMYPARAEALPVSSAALTQILRSGDPLFNGLLPPVKPAIDRASAAIERYLAWNHPDLRVRGVVVATGPERFAIEFSPAGGLPVIAAVTFEGSALIAAGELRLAMLEGAIGQRFNDAGIHALLDSLIRPLYEKQGYMRVAFPKITTKPASDVTGIDVHVTVVDGPQFTLGSVSVRGPLAGDQRRILRMANIPLTGIIDYDAFVEGAARIRDTLHGEGYLDVNVSTGRAIDDATKTVDVWFDVQPGIVFTFSRLEVIGLGLEGEAAIRKMWSVKPGDPFPAGYQDRFVKGVKGEELFDNPGDITATPKIDRQTHKVDVTLFFSVAPTSRQPRGTQY